MSIGKLISVKHPVYDAMQLLGIDHDRFIPKFTKWAIDAEKDIGAFAQFTVKRKVLDIKGCVACLPADAVRVQVAILGDYGENCADLMNSACAGLNLSTTYGTVANTFLVVDINSTESGNTCFGMINYSIQNNKIILKNCENDEGKLTIQYLAYETDSEGFTMVGENHVKAIMWYIVWFYYFGLKGKNSLEYGQMSKAEDQWHRECRHARAMDGQLTAPERQQVINMYHNPYVGIGLAVGMHTTLE